MSYEKDLQDAFLNHVRAQHIPVTVFLVNGVKLQGRITWFDNYCLLLKRDRVSQLVYKHAISTIMPSRPVRLYDDEDVEEEESFEAQEQNEAADDALENEDSEDS